MILRTVVVGTIKTNCYIVACERTRDAIVIDPGGDAPKIIQAIEELDVHVRRIVLTHFHFDHTMAAPELRDHTGARLCIHRSEAQYLMDPPAEMQAIAADFPGGLKPDVLLDEGEHFSIGQMDAEVVLTPGHSPGSISLWMPPESAVFSGDVLFRGSVGRTDLPGGDAAMLFQTVRDKLFVLPDETYVYPGHGSRTTIEYERQNNPFVGVNAPWPD